MSQSVKLTRNQFIAIVIACRININSSKSFFDMASLMVQSIVSAHPIRVLKNHITHKEYSFLHLYFAF